MGQLADLWMRLLAVRPADVLDVLLVATLIFGLLFFFRGTRAVQLLRGILLVVLVFMLFSRVVPLPTFSAIVRGLLQMLIVAIPVVFQPELRRMMERLGRAGRLLSRPAEGATSTVVPVIARAARRLSEAGHGGLIVLERTVALEDVAERGLRIDAEPSVDLLLQLFYPNSPLHDGAVIVRAGRLVAARVVLPLRDAPLRAEGGFGTRHLAAIAASESSDALVVVVSEETGIISVADGGRLRRGLDEGALARLLAAGFIGTPGPAERWLATFIRLATGDALGRHRAGDSRSGGSDRGASA